MLDFVTSDSVCHCCAGGGYPREGLRALSAAPTTEVFVCKRCVESGEVCVQCRAVIQLDEPTVLVRKAAQAPTRIYALCHGCVTTAVRPLTLLLGL